MEMNVQETNEIHELTTAELELVAGGMTDENYIQYGYALATLLGGPAIGGFASLIGERGYLMGSLHR
jgi:hypothetical protein